MRTRAFPAALFLLLASCASAPAGREAAGAAPQPPFPACRFAVLSDPHVYARTLGAFGKSFDSMRRDGSKLLALSEEIFAAALDAVAAEAPDFLLVCGDLTKDGEMESHLLAARMLHGLEARGIPVYVVPGNHDIANPRSRGYAGDRAHPVENIGPADFAAIYRDFGYAEALEEDPSSFGYVAEPVPGLRLLGLDACRYGQDGSAPAADGRFAEPSLSWARRAAGAARGEGAVLLTFLHHGLVEHFRGQSLVFPENLVFDHPLAARLLAEAGVEVVFTGHGHAQDAAEIRWGDGLRLLDVETGSLVSYPCPFRIATLREDGTLVVQSRFISDLPGAPEGLAVTAKEGMIRGVRMRAVPVLESLGLSSRSLETIAAAAVDGMLAFFHGDEPAAAEAFPPEGLDWWGAVVASILSGPLASVRTDIPPSDNDLTVKLRR